MARISDQDLKRVVAAVDLRKVIGADIKLRRAGGGRLVGLSPFSAEKTSSFSVWDDHYHCFSTNTHGSVFDWLMHSRHLDFPSAYREARIIAGLGAPGDEVSPAKLAEIDRQSSKRSEDEAAYRARMVELAQTIIAGAGPASGSPVADYFRGDRGVDLDAIGGLPPVLRFHRRVRNRSGEYFPAMVAPVGLYGRARGVHLTFLETVGGRVIKLRPGVGPKGKKRAAKMMIGECFGHAVDLSPQFCGTASLRRLNIGEGLESVVSAVQIDLEAGRDIARHRYVAALSLGNLTGAQARDGRGRPQFTQPRLKEGFLSKVRADLPRGVPLPDLSRPAFLPPKGFSGDIRILAEDDLKDCKKTGLTGTQRAQEAYHLAVAKFRLADPDKAGVCERAWIAWPPKGCDFNDILQARRGLSGDAPQTAKGAAA